MYRVRDLSRAKRYVSNSNNGPLAESFDITVIVRVIYILPISIISLSVATRIYFSPDGNESLALPDVRGGGSEWWFLPRYRKSIVCRRFKIKIMTTILFLFTLHFILFRLSRTANNQQATSFQRFFCPQRNLEALKIYFDEKYVLSVY